MDEHVLQDVYDLQLPSSTLKGNRNYIQQLSENTFYQQYMFTSGDYESCSVPQWIRYPPMAPCYVDYLSGIGISNVQREIPYESTGIGSSFTRDESLLNMDAHQVRDLRLTHEELLVNKLKNMADEICYQKQVLNEGVSDAAQQQPNMLALSSGIQTKSRRNISRQKALDSDRRRRIRIASALETLEDLLPQSTEGNKSNTVDNCIDYIKYLQLQMKELSQNRLGGEQTSNFLAYVEGYGHYLVHGNTASKPLQDTFAKLLEVNPSAATKLLESRGLYMMPFPPN